MKIAFFETKDEEKEFFKERLKDQELHFFKESINEALKEKSYDFTAVSVFINSKIDDEILKKLPKLKYIQTRSAGYDHIKCVSLYKRGILASNVAGYAGYAVSEFAFSLLLNASRYTCKAIERAKRGNFKYLDLKGFELFGKKLGILGLGNIGERMARIGKGFGMELFAYSRTEKPVVKELDINFTTLEEVLKNSDVLMIALPLTPSTKNLINRKNSSLIKKECVIVNVARAEIMEDCVYRDLKNVLCLDVITNTDYVKKENILYTPHMAYYTKEALKRIMEISLNNMRAFIEGRPLPNCLKFSCEKDYKRD